MKLRPRGYNERKGLIGSRFVTQREGDRLIEPEETRPELNFYFTAPDCLLRLRQWIHTHITAAPDTVQDLQLVCTELVTNAIEHGGGHGRVQITTTQTRARIEVTDSAADAALTPGRSRLGHYRGRSLAMVARVALCGVNRSEHHKTVWATIATKQPDEVPT